MSAITTHILDTSLGKPAANVPVLIDFLEDGVWSLVGQGQTDEDGRVKNLLHDDFEFKPGQYRIEFATSDYFSVLGVKGFYPYVKIVFQVEDTESHYHVPLLLNPFGYSTYRGS
jgi:5-hydroxyisourate hydrolase